MKKICKWDCALPPPPSLFIFPPLLISHSLTLFVGSLMGARIDYGGGEKHGKGARATSGRGDK